MHRHHPVCTFAPYCTRLYMFYKYMLSKINSLIRFKLPHTPAVLAGPSNPLRSGTLNLAAGAHIVGVSFRGYQRLKGNLLRYLLTTASLASEPPYQDPNPRQIQANVRVTFLESHSILSHTITRSGEGHISQLKFKVDDKKSRTQPGDEHLS